MAVDGEALACEGEGVLLAFGSAEEFQIFGQFHRAHVGEALFKADSLVRIRKSSVGSTNTTAALIFIDGMASADLISNHILTFII